MLLSVLGPRHPADWLAATAIKRTLKSRLAWHSDGNPATLDGIHVETELG